MPQPLPIIAQYTMDAYYQAYKSASQFFDLQDFIFNCGATIAAIFQDEVKLKYAELRAAKSEDVVSLPADWLLEQALKVDRKDNQTFVTLEKPVMSFSWDNQVLGVQDVLPVKPVDAKLERTTQTANWQTQYVPFTNRTFWHVKGEKIFFQRKGGCNISEVSILYIPSISADMLVPDGIVDNVMNQTIAKMRQAQQGIVVKKSVDGNQNLVLEGEMNKQSLK